MLAHGRWFSPGAPASSITKTGGHDIAWNIAESGVKHQQSNQFNQSESIDVRPGIIWHTGYLYGFDQIESI